MQIGYSKLELLLHSGFQVFTVRDLALRWQMSNEKDVAQLAGYYTKQGRLHRLKGGLYSLVPTPEQFEIAQKAFTPSYISGQSALRYHGIIFQYYDFVSCMSIARRTITINGSNYQYHQLSRELFFNSLGLIKKQRYMIAGPERAIIDSLYINSSIGFDNLEGLDTGLLQELAKLYNQPRIWKALKLYFPGLKSEHSETNPQFLVKTYAY